MVRHSAPACLARGRTISCRSGARGCPKHERMSSKCEQVARRRPGGDLRFSTAGWHAFASRAAQLCCRWTGIFRRSYRLFVTRCEAGLNYPLVETLQEWIIHGFSHANYLAELGHKAQSEIYKKSSLDQAMKDAFRKAHRFLMTAKDFSEERPSRCCRSASISASPKSSTGTSAFTPSSAKACSPTKADAACSALSSQMMRGASKGRSGSAAHVGLAPTPTPPAISAR